MIAARDLRKDRLALALRSGTSGPDRRRALGTLVESALVRAWRAAIAPLAERPQKRTWTTEGVALAAVGSIARGDAGPASDLDLVLLHDGRHLSTQEVG